VAELNDPGRALEALAGELRIERSVISSHVVARPAEDPHLGLLAAAGPRTGAAPGEYALVVEAVREGYLLHFATPRLVEGADPDLALLAGDYLYALGLARLAGLRDLDAVRELSDLISLAAQIHDGSRGPDEAREAAAAVWLGAAVAIAAGPAPDHEPAKAALRAGEASALGRLAAAAAASAAAAGIDEQLRRAALAIDFGADDASRRP
jgi:hypothetical protein